MFLQHEAVKLEPHLEAMPLNPKQMDLPEFQGLEKNNIPDLRAGAEMLDQQALRQAKAEYQPGTAVTKHEYRTRSIQHSLSALLGITPEQAKKQFKLLNKHTNKISPLIVYIPNIHDIVNNKIGSTKDAKVCIRYNFRNK
jgi:hypothetical protein